MICDRLWVIDETRYPQLPRYILYNIYGRVAEYYADLYLTDSAP